jgi:hypothetical protein
MKVKENMEKTKFLDAYKINQLRHIAKNTTPEQRYNWLEDTRYFLFTNGLLDKWIKIRNEEIIKKFNKDEVKT